MSWREIWVTDMTVGMLPPIWDPSLPTGLTHRQRMGDGVEGTLLGLNLVPKIMGAALFWSLQPYIYIACTALLSRALG